MCSNSFPDGPGYSSETFDPINELDENYMDPSVFNPFHNDSQEEEVFPNEITKVDLILTKLVFTRLKLFILITMEVKLCLMKYLLESNLQ